MEIAAPIGTIYKIFTLRSKAVNAARHKRILTMSHGTTIVNLIQTYKSNPTKEAKIPSIAFIKYIEFFRRSKKGATVITIKNEGVNIAIVATIAPSIP